MGKTIIITESQLKKITDRIIEESMEKGEQEEGIFHRIFGKPDIEDAAHSSLRGQGHSHIGKEDDDELYVVFDGQKFYEGDIMYADEQDMGEIPRVEDGKLIVANPMWSM